MIKYIFVTLLCLLLLSGCDGEHSDVPVFELQKQQFEIMIKGFGEVESAEATLISSPGRQPMMIDWLAPENSMVKKGDVIARFDPQQLLLDSRQEELEILSLQQDMEQSRAQQTQQQNEVDSEQGLVKKEFQFVDRFAIDDVRLYSKLEIIDTMQNREFLGAKEDFLGWKEGSIEEQHQSAVDVLDIKRKGHETRYNQHQDALSKLNVYAPFDGLLTYEKDWRGEKPSIGQTVFPGTTIAKIPNLDSMQAKVYVLAKEAIGLAPQQPVDLILDAYPDLILPGKVVDVSGFPRSIERGNPVKYYELTVALLEQDKKRLQPGRKLKATIKVQAPVEKLMIPLQAIHHKSGRSFVYLQDGSHFIEQDVTTGQKNLYFVEIIKGLTIGSVIALSTPLQPLSNDKEAY